MFTRFIRWLKARNRLKPFLGTVNRIGIHPYLINGEQFRRVIHLAQPGDAILIRTFLESTTLLQQSKFTHTATKSPTSTMIVDATGVGVKKRDILNLGVGINRVCIRRPRLSAEKRMEIARKTESYIGAPYDFSFSMGPRTLTKVEAERVRQAVYCSELYYWNYNDVNPGVLKRSMSMGIMVFTSDDIYEDNNCFETIIDERAELAG